MAKICSRDIKKRKKSWMCVSYGFDGTETHSGILILIHIINYECLLKGFRKYSLHLCWNILYQHRQNQIFEFDCLIITIHWAPHSFSDLPNYRVHIIVCYVASLSFRFCGYFSVSNFLYFYWFCCFAFFLTFPFLRILPLC